MSRAAGTSRVALHVQAERPMTAAQMAEVFGEDNGVGARSAVGHNALPGNIPVEIECIFEVST